MDVDISEGVSLNFWRKIQLILPSNIENGELENHDLVSSSTVGESPTLSTQDCECLWDEATSTDTVDKLVNYFDACSQQISHQMRSGALKAKDKTAMLNFLCQYGIIKMKVSSSVRLQTIVTSENAITENGFKDTSLAHSAAKSGNRKPAIFTQSENALPQNCRNEESGTVTASPQTDQCGTSPQCVIAACERQSEISMCVRENQDTISTPLSMIRDANLKCTERHLEENTPDAAMTSMQSRTQPMREQPSENNSSSNREDRNDDKATVSKIQCHKDANQGQTTHVKVEQDAESQTLEGENHATTVDGPIRCMPLQRTILGKKYLEMEKECSGNVYRFDEATTSMSAATRAPSYWTVKVNETAPSSDGNLHNVFNSQSLTVGQNITLQSTPQYLKMSGGVTSGASPDTMATTNKNPSSEIKMPLINPMEIIPTIQKFAYAPHHGDKQKFAYNLHHGDKQLSDYRAKRAELVRTARQTLTESQRQKIRAQDRERQRRYRESIKAKRKGEPPAPKVLTESQKQRIRELGRERQRRHREKVRRLKGEKDTTVGLDNGILHIMNVQNPIVISETVKSCTSTSSCT